MTNEQILDQLRQGGDLQKAAGKLYARNFGYIHKAAFIIAGKYARNPDKHTIKDLQRELEQEAYFGLLEAVQSWSPDKDVLFLSYAGYWIKQAMYRYCDNTNSAVRLPVGRLAQIREYRKIRETFQKLEGRRPTDKEYCRLLKVGPDVLEAIRAAAQVQHLQSLDQPLNSEDEEAGTVGDLVPAAGDPYGPVLDRLHLEELQAVLWSAVDALPEDQAHVIRENFQKGKTLQQIGREIGGCSKARSAKEKALRALRRNRALQAFDNERRYSYGIRGGLQSWNQTGTSSTEWAAFKMLEGI